MNLKLRLQNKVTLTAIATLVLAIIYQVLGMIGIVPSIGQDQVTEVVTMVISLLVLLGVVVDPTTPDIKDSAVSMDKESINETAKEVVIRELSNEDMAEILSKVKVEDN